MQAGLDAPTGPEELFPWVGDLGRYPAWLNLIREVLPVEGGTDRPHVASPASPASPAWMVTLSARIGPLRRSKRLRMVRTVYEPPFRARFERDEADGRDHAAWVLDAQIAPTAGGSHLTMELHYDGSLWGPIVEAVLRQQIEAARPNLVACATGARQ